MSGHKTMSESQRATGAFAARLINAVSDGRKAGLNSETILERIVIEIAGQFGLGTGLDDAAERQAETRPVPPDAGSRHAARRCDS